MELRWLALINVLREIALRYCAVNIDWKQRRPRIESQIACARTTGEPVGDRRSSIWVIRGY